MSETASMVKDVGYNDTADRLEQNKPLIKQYLIENIWTRSDLTLEKWTKDEKYGCYYFGKITDNLLRNT